jgi:tetratricopeptide (TPR) repeat protein
MSRLRLPLPACDRAPILALGLVLSILSGWTPAFAIENSSGPATPEGAKLTWTEARDAYQQGHYADAIGPIERLLARYPGYPDATAYLEARAWLGHSQLVLGAPSEAVAPLSAYIEGAGRANPPLTSQARIWLGDSYVELGHYQEALLTARELALKLEAAPDAALPPEFEAQALQLKARALIGLGRMEEAARAVASAASPSERSAKPPILGEQRLLETRIKARECGRLPSAPSLEEAETIDQLNRRGLCLEESIVLFERLITTGSEEHVQRGEEMVAGAFTDYTKACENPPAPVFRAKNHHASSMHGTPAARARYRTELIARLMPSCRAHAASASELLRKWQSAETAPSGAHSPTIQALRTELSRLALPPQDHEPPKGKTPS